VACVSNEVDHHLTTFRQDLTCGQVERMNCSSKMPEWKVAPGERGMEAGTRAKRHDSDAYAAYLEPEPTDGVAKVFSVCKDGVGSAAAPDQR